MGLQDGNLLFENAGQAVIKFWKMRIGKNISVTRIRQIIHTAASEHLDKEDVEKIARGDTHTFQVSEIHYNKQEALVIANQADKVFHLLKTKVIEQAAP